MMRADDPGGLRALAGTSFPALALLYAALFGAFGTVTPFMPSFLAARGLDPRAIGAVFAAGTLVRIASAPLIGAAAARLGTRAVRQASPPSSPSAWRTPSPSPA